MTETKTDLWQSHMTAAYDRWQQHQDWSYGRFLLSCNGLERVAVLLGNLKYQVENGGISQWVCNDYARHASEVIETLRMIGREQGCAVAGKVAERIQSLMRYVDCTDRELGCCFVTDDEDESYWLADSFDTWYYREAQPELVKAIEAWFEAAAK